MSFVPPNQRTLGFPLGYDREERYHNATLNLTFPEKQGVGDYGPLQSGGWYYNFINQTYYMPLDGCERIYLYDDDEPAFYVRNWDGKVVPKKRIPSITRSRTWSDY